MEYKIRILENKDVSFMLEWMHDEDINKNFTFNAKNYTEDNAIDFIEKSWVDKEHRHYAIADANDEYLGTISLKNISLLNRTAEYAIALRTRAIGKGVSSYATKEIIKIAFEELDLNRVYLNVLSENTRAIKFYEKMNFVYEGEFKQHILKDGILKNLKWYAVLKN